ncbi:serine hydrolase [Mucilaginibacter terrigena]|uniref:Serine hydrolase n=1 Tax=Mucilaginibacter terrigena TaxID=2492395 RepID=A0A4Q5LHG4_9SPHI|nr:serine hydrolase [Mucilaginibacter terrigena]RYU86916.1 serine hydrolase [Mucilaginibacter terrigena]
MKIYLVIIAMLLSQAIFGQSNIAKVDSLMSQLIRYKVFRGSILVAQNGKIIFKKSNGLANIGTKDFITDNTPFYLASVSKTFTAVAITQLIEKGKLNFNDNLKKFYPNFPAENITVKDLLAHTSGIADYIADLYIPYWDENKIPDSLHKISSNKEVIAFLLRKYPGKHFETGKYQEYMNTNYVILASIIEKVSGQSYTDYLHEHIFSPYNMQHSFVYFQDSIPNHAIGYKYSFYKDTAKSNNLGILNGVYGDGGLYSTTEDLLKFINGYFSGRLVSTKMVNTATVSINLNMGPPIITKGLIVLLLGLGLTWFARRKKWWWIGTFSIVAIGIVIISIGISFKKSDIPDYGLGWQTKNYNNEAVAYHTGGWGGANNIIWHEKSGLTIIVLSNNGICPSYDLALEISNIFHNKPYKCPTPPIASFYCREIIKNDDTSKAIHVSKSIWENDIKNIKRRYQQEESDLNEAGYEFLKLNKIPESLAAFRLNTQLFPNSWNAFDSYGEALMAAGKKPESIAAYKKSLELNPSNKNAADKIK